LIAHSVCKNLTTAIYSFPRGDRRRSDPISYERGENSPCTTCVWMWWEPA